MQESNIKSSRVVLGIAHIGLGALILFVSYGTDLRLGERLLEIAGTLPQGTLLIAGLVEGTYWLGGVLPGTTFMLFYLLVAPQNLGSALISIVLIWGGVASGMIVSYFSGRLLRSLRRRPDEAEIVGRGRLDIAKLLFGLHPTLAATYLFESGYNRRPLLTSFAMPAIGGFLALVFYVAAIFGFREGFSGASGELGLIFGVGFILWGAWRVFTGLAHLPRRRTST